MLVQMFLWSAIYASAPSAIVYGYSFEQMMLYTLFSGFITIWVRTGFEMEISEDVKGGQLDRFLVQPLGYSRYRIALFLGRKVTQLVVVLVMLLIGLIFMNWQILGLLHIQRLGWGAAALVLAVVLNYYIFLSISLLSFWSTDASGFFSTFHLISNIASGGVFPLNIFTGGVRLALSALPFQYVVYFPICILNGQIESSEIVGGILMQLLWILVFWGLSALLWRKGISKYVSVGG